MPRRCRLWQVRCWNLANKDASDYSTEIELPKLLQGGARGQDDDEYAVPQQRADMKRPISLERPT